MTRFIYFFLPLLVSFSFTPMSQTIELSQGQKEAQFLLDNPTNEPMAVVISVTDRKQKTDGQEDNAKTSELIAFPPQLILPPKEKRTIRVQWTGEKPNLEKAFRVVAEQLPLKVDGKKQKGSGIKMLMRYKAALYVNPGETEASLVLGVIEESKDGLKVHIENKGSQHRLLLNPTLSVTAGKKTINLNGEALKGLAGENVLAGSKRVFTIASHPELKGAELKGKLKVE